MRDIELPVDMQPSLELKRVLDMSYSPSSLHMYTESWALRWLLDNLSLPSTRLLAFILESMTWCNYTPVTVKQLVKRSGMLQPNISRYKRELLERRVIFDSMPILKRSGHIVNPNLCWIGPLHKRLEFTQMINCVKDYNAPPYQKVEDGTYVDMITGEAVGGVDE